MELAQAARGQLLPALPAMNPLLGTSPSGRNSDPRSIWRPKLLGTKPTSTSTLAEHKWNISCWSAARKVPRLVARMRDARRIVRIGLEGGAPLVRCNSGDPVAAVSSLQSSQLCPMRPWSLAEQLHDYVRPDTRRSTARRGQLNPPHRQGWTHSGNAPLRLSIACVMKQESSLRASQHFLPRRDPRQTHLHLPVVRGQLPPTTTFPMDTCGQGRLPARNGQSRQPQSADVGGIPQQREQKHRRPGACATYCHSHSLGSRLP